MAEQPHDLGAYPDPTQFKMSPGLGTEELLFPDHDIFIAPETPEQWHNLAVTSMHVLADIGRQNRMIQENEGVTFDAHQSIAIKTNTWTMAEHHYHRESEDSAPTEIVKVYLNAVPPLPLANRPPDMSYHDWLAQLGAEVKRYEQEQAERPELDWISTEQDQPEDVLILGGPHGGKKLRDLEPQDLQSITERLQGTALMAALAMRRYDLAGQVAHLRGPDVKA